METIDSYLALDIRTSASTFECLVQADDLGWITLDDTYECLFRVVPLYSMKETFQLRDKMLETGYFYPQVNHRKTLEMVVRYLYRANLFFLFEWDEDQGCTDILCVIRAGDWFSAEEYFTKNYEVVYPEGQVQHISNLRGKGISFKDLELEADLIKG